MIIKRYLIKEAFKAQLYVLCVLLIVFISQHFIRILSDAADGEIPTNFILQLVGLKLPYVLTLILPFSLFLGIFFYHGRMYVNHEMTALHALGFSEWAVTRTLMLVATVNIILFCILSFYIKPWADYKSEELLTHIDANTSIDTLTAGRFIHPEGSKSVIFVDKIDPNNTLQTIFVAHKSDYDKNSKYHILMAQEGYVKKDKSNQQNLILAQGTRYTTFDEKLNFEITTFDRYRMLLQVHKRDIDLSLSSLPLNELKKLNDPIAQGLYYWNISLPLMLPILTLLAVPLARVNTRQGKFAKIVPAILIYISYFIALMVGRRAIEQSLFPAEFGLWWIHGIVLCVAIYLFKKPTVQQRKWFVRFKPRATS